MGHNGCNSKLMMNMSDTGSDLELQNNINESSLIEMGSEMNMHLDNVNTLGFTDSVDLRKYNKAKRKNESILHSPTRCLLWGILALLLTILVVVSELIGKTQNSGGWFLQPQSSRTRGLGKTERVNDNRLLQTLEEKTARQFNDIVNPFFENDAILPPLPLPIVDSTSATRCNVLRTLHDPSVTSLNQSRVTVKINDGFVLATVEAKDTTGQSMSTGGDVFICQLTQSPNATQTGPKLQNSTKRNSNDRNFSHFSFSYDHCSGTYTCSFNVKHSPAGKYHVKLVHMTTRFMHEAQTVAAPTCGAVLGAVYINASEFAALGRHKTSQVDFFNASVVVGPPQQLKTNGLPPCNFQMSPKGRWVVPSVCMTDNPSISTCRRGDARNSLNDIYTWVPDQCSLRYVTPEMFAQKAIESDNRKILIMGDSRSYNLFLLISDFLRGVNPDPETGIVPLEALSISGAPPEIRSYDNWYGKSVNYTATEARNLTVILSDTYGTRDRFTEFPCPEPDNMSSENYFVIRDRIGIFFEKLDVFLSDASRQPDVLILQDGALHEMFHSYTDEQYVNAVEKVIFELKHKFHGRVIYFAMPAAHVTDTHFGFAVRSESKQWKRTRVGISKFRQAGYDVWDTHLMSAMRADRYFDANHFYPKMKYQRAWNSFPMTLGHEMLQDLLNRMYEWND